MVDLDIDMNPEPNDYNHAGYWPEEKGDNNNSPGICFYFGTLAVWWGVIYKCITLKYD